MFEQTESDDPARRRGERGAAGAAAALAEVPDSLLAATQADTPEQARARQLLKGLGFCGHYLHFKGGGRSGKAPIICLIAKHGGKMAQQELGASFDLKPGSLSEILAKMETSGLIERTRNPDDRRQLTIHLTASGQEAATREQRRRTRFRNQAFTCLTDAEQEQLVGMLDKIRAHWEELDD